MNNVSAVVLSDKPYDRRFAGVEVVEYISKISTPQQLASARFAALAEVKTEWCFYLDDDDDLPVNHEELLCKLINDGTAFDAAIVYTDELVKTESSQRLRKSQPYSQSAHLQIPLLIHHLAMFRTEAALEAVKRMPTGIHCPEMPLFFELAKRGALYVPVIGYIWNKRKTGMHNWPMTHVSWTQAQIWCARNRE